MAEENPINRILNEIQKVEGARVAEGFVMAGAPLTEIPLDGMKGLVIPKAFISEAPPPPPADGTRGAVIPKQFVPPPPPPSEGDKK